MLDALHSLVFPLFVYAFLAHFVIERERIKTKTSKIDKTYLGFACINELPVIAASAILISTTTGAWHIVAISLCIYSSWLFLTDGIVYLIKRRQSPDVSDNNTST